MLSDLYRNKQDFEKLFYYTKKANSRFRNRRQDALIAY